MKKYILITDAVPDQVEAATGIKGHLTPLGTLVEEPVRFDIHGAMAILDRAFNPNRCTCGAYALLHRPNCPAGNVMT